MLFVGHTRFSVFSPSSPTWQASRGDLLRSEAEYREYLYDPERLDLRCEIFFGESLPILAEAQKGHDVRHVVSYSDSLPSKYQQLLEDAATRHPFLVLDRLEHGSDAGDLDRVDLLDRVAQDAQREAGTDPNGAPYATYRLDDDDLMSIDVFDRVAAFVNEGTLGMMISFGSGLTVARSAEGYTNLRSVHLPMIAIGLFRICGRDRHGAFHSPPMGPHMESDRRAPVILDSREPAFLWVRHEDQDTTFGRRPELRHAKMLDDMERYPAVEDALPVLRHFPTLASTLTADLPCELAPQSITLTTSTTELEQLDLTGPFDLTVETVASEDVEERNAVFTFDLEQDGRTDFDATELQAWGLALSDSMGAYCYLSPPVGAGQTTVRLDLPADVTCHAIRVSKWRRREADIRIESVRLSKLQPQGAEPGTE